MTSPLQGGRRRRRRGARLALLALLLAPVVVGLAAYVAFTRDSGDPEPLPPVATAPAPKPPAGGELEPESPAPVRLSGVDAFRLRLRKPMRSALLFDMDSGEALWRRRPLTQLPIASLTKIMTAILVTERAGPEEKVRITRAALRFQGSGLGVLKPRRRVRLETLLNGLLLVSGNDAAIALAIHVAGSQRRFVGIMNRRAREWGLRCTRFADAHGLSSGNRSCAADLAVMSRMAMREKRIRRIVRRTQVSFRFPIKGGRLYLAGHNPLLRLGYRGAIGLKTGYTDPAGRCFVGVARRNGRTLGVVLLNSPNPATHAPRLLDLGFRSA